jgi:DNA excision repair protein ERCC-4
MLKPTDITIVIDTREQKPLDFTIGEVEIPTVKGTLATGDYSLVGLTNIVAVERKSLSDLVGSLTAGRDRFMREIHRLQAYPYRLLVVEAHYIDIEAQKYRSKAHPNSIIGSLMSIQGKHQIPVLMAGDARRAGLYTARFLYSAARHRFAELETFGKSINP